MLCPNLSQTTLLAVCHRFPAHGHDQTFTSDNIRQGPELPFSADITSDRSCYCVRVGGHGRAIAEEGEDEGQPRRHGGGKCEEPHDSNGEKYNLEEGT